MHEASPPRVPDRPGPVGAGGARRPEGKPQEVEPSGLARAEPDPVLSLRRLRGCPAGVMGGSPPVHLASR